jgi:hypothetical protein
MSYRITNTEKWKDLWFSNLSINAKLLFFYFVENCDNAGFFEVNKKFMLFHTGFNEDELYKAGNEIKKSYIKSKDGTKLWLRNFLKYQKKLPLNPANGNHKQIIGLIKENLADENKFKGSDVLNSILPIDLQFTKTQRKKKEVVEKSETFEPIDNTSNKPQESPAKNVKFIKPSVNNVYEYMAENEFEFAQTESMRFVNYYESNGWKVGKNPMKVWKSAVITWMSNYYERNRISTPKLSKLKEIQEAHQEVENVDWNEKYGNKFVTDNNNEQLN